MRTVFDVKKQCDPLTMWKAVKDKAEVNREARREAEEEAFLRRADDVIVIEKFWKRR